VPVPRAGGACASGAGCASGGRAGSVPTQELLDRVAGMRILYPTALADASPLDVDAAAAVVLCGDGALAVTAADLAGRCRGDVGRGDVGRHRPQRQRGRRRRRRGPRGCARAAAANEKTTKLNVCYTSTTTVCAASASPSTDPS